MFVGVVVRGKVVVPPARITMIYGALYEVVWLWRYSGANMAPRHEKFLQRVGEFFFSLEFALVSENAIKIFCLVGGGDHPPRIRSSFRKCNKKFLPYGGGGVPPPSPLKYKVA